MPVRALAGRPNKTARRPLPVVNKLRGHSTSPPVGGWNARDALANMAEDEAIDLINWFPEESRVRMRRGHASHATGFSSNVETLMSWKGPTSSKLFAVSGPGLYNCTALGTVGSPDISGLTSSRFQHTMFSNSAGSYLFIVNGSDAPMRYNGTSWFTPNLTGSGLTASNLIHINAFKNRLFFVEKDTLNFWYLPVNQVAGTLTKFDLGPQADLGGHLMAMGTWTRDGGSGVDDLAVFITSKGQCIIYQGSDPGVVNDWFLVGVFNIAAPIGRRCFIKVGADLIVITIDGFSQLSRFLAGARTSDRAAMSDKISGAVNEAVRDHRDRFGWQPIFYPLGNMMIFNVPQTNASVQFVSNATTGAWCKFTGWDAECFEIHNEELYFGGAAAVYKADTGLHDNDAAIDATAKTAFSYFGSRDLLKRFAMVRPNLVIDGSVTAAMRINVDFEDEAANTVPTLEEPEGEEWDVAEWDVAEWGEANRINKNWQTIGGLGTCASMLLECMSSNGTIHWNANDWKYELVANPGFL